MKQPKHALLTALLQAPDCPGVYLFKTAQGSVVYIGKAKVLRARVRHYKLGFGKEWKATTILSKADTVEYVETASELEALLLEAKLIQSYQPPCNVLLKTGQPYIYFVITRPKQDLPRFEMVRNKHKKGTYFGPFIDRSAAKKAFLYLQKTFQLQVCNKTIEGGCLAYHMHRCAGTCRSDFDREAYEQRLALVGRALRKDRSKVIRELEKKMEEENARYAFEKAQQLKIYRDACVRVYETLMTSFDKPNSLRRLADKDIWVMHSDDLFFYLIVFRETDGVVSKHRLFCLPQQENQSEQVQEYITSYYREYMPSQQVWIDTLSGSIELDCDLIEKFCVRWHSMAHSIDMVSPLPENEIATLARVYAEKETAKKRYLGRDLKAFLQIPFVPKTIDCFDISHKQGHAMVGSCVRFKDGQPAADGYRHFHIKSLDQQNDYAALQEIVMRRYKEASSLPDIIVIDGGKGQLSAVQAVLGSFLRGRQTALISLAKREETVFSAQFPEGKRINQKSIAGQTLIALRDYAHHAAISFHRKTSLRKIS